MTEHQYPDERRRNDSIMLELVQTIDRKVDSIRQDLSDHTAKEPAMFDAAFKSAFPDGDPLAHAKYHEEVMDQLHERTVFWKETRASLARWGLLGLLGWLMYVAWIAFLQGPKN